MGPPVKKYNLEEFLFEANSNEDNDMYFNAIMCFKKGIQSSLINNRFKDAWASRGLGPDLELQNFINQNYDNDELYKLFLTCLKTDYMLFVDDFLYEIAEKKYDIFLRFLEGNSFHLLNEDISEEDLQIFNNEWQIFQKHTNELVNRFKNELTKSNETFFSITENILKNDELSSELKKIWYNTASKIVNTFDENLNTTTLEMGTKITREFEKFRMKLETQIQVNYDFFENSFCIKRIKEHRTNIELVFNTIKKI